MADKKFAEKVVSCLSGATAVGLVCVSFASMATWHTTHDLTVIFERHTGRSSLDKCKAMLSCLPLK